jgi:3-hydroxyacyl-CoA dehydrogenase
MTTMMRLGAWTATRASDATLALYTRVVHGGRERGDVPGWVLVTIMTAGLVTALWVVADDKLKQLFSDALDGVVGNAP